jgi:transketolase
MRKAFAESMLEMAEKDDKLVVLIGDISHHLLKDFEASFPDRFYNVGICEQSMVGMAAGLAMEGFRPVVHTIAPFCVERAYEQIKVDLCYQNLDVTIVSVGGSFDYAHLGCTHHCYEDVSILRPLPNIDIFTPGTSKEFKTLFSQSWNNGRSKYFKLSKTEHKQNIDVSAYEYHIINKGSKKLIFVSGHLLQDVLHLNNYEENTIVYCPTVEPISSASQQTATQLMKEHDSTLVIEENSTSGAIADKIFDIASSNNVRTVINKMGIPRQFCTAYGSVSDHRENLGLTTQGIQNKINELKYV